MAHNYGPGMKLPTAQQLAAQFGVTLTTLDRALAKLETRSVITRRQGSGIYVSNGLLDKRIGLVFGRNIFRFGSSAFYLLLLQECERAAEIGNYQFSLFLSPKQYNTPIEAGQFNPELDTALKQRKLDGLLACEINNDNYELWLANQNIPTVALAPSKHFPTVGIDSNQLIEHSVAHLAAQGCRTVGLLGILSRHYEYFTAATQKYGIKIKQEAVIHPEDEKDPPFDVHEQLGREWISKCLECCGGKKNLPDGMVVTDDLLARGACLQMKEYGIRIGEDLKIVSHANKGSLSLEYWEDHITIAEIDPAQMVSEMFQILDKLMDGKKLTRKKTNIQASLISKNSTQS
ncbi:LacI family DNA-binding transcriptional regulator [Cerasicoccus frondis]|uniref:LacI family DNA-binding transcriptional regulator n=1 Tax=Cerasicoccus frondis TaxID=490090 RepID=UPI0028529753|nr:LacI family DNA-binding transcriptional regulator [Cerasicoccus frondis]